MRYIKQPKIINKVIIDCLDNLEKNSDAAIKFLYNVAHNYWFEKNANQIKSNSLSIRINRLIDKLPFDESCFYLLGNIESILSKKDRSSIITTFFSTNFKAINSARVWSVILYFANGDTKTINKVKAAILKNPKLWNSGITTKGGTFPFDYISLYKLRKKNDTRGIEWNENQKKIIFDRLKIEFKKIEEFVSKKSYIDGYDPILEEMIDFIKDEMPDTITTKRYLSRIAKVYKSQRGYVDLFDGLSSKDHDKVVIATNELSKYIYQKRDVKPYMEYVTFILDKLLVKANPALGDCLFYISNWFFNFRNDPCLKLTSNTIIRILLKYKNESATEDLDLPSQKEYLVRLAFVLKHWGIRDPVVNDLLAEAKNSRFNNLRFAFKDSRQF